MSQIWKRLGVGTLILFLSFMMQSRFASAQTAEEYVKQAEGDLKKSHSLIISERHKDAVEILKKVDKTIAAAQKSDASNPRLTGVIKTFMTQKEKIEKKLGIAIEVNFTAAATAATVETKGKSATAGSSKTGSSQALPYDARHPMQQFNSAYASFEDYYNQFSGGGADMKAIWIKRLKNHLDAMVTNLASAKEEASKKNVTAHPDFDEAERKIAESEKKYEDLNRTYQQEVTALNEQTKTVQVDADAVKELYAGLRSKIFDRAGGSVIYYNDASELGSLLDQIEQFEKNEKAAVEKNMEGFASKYGSTEEAVEKSTGDWQAANSIIKIKEGLSNIGKTREATANDLIAKYESGFSDVSSKHDFYKVSYLQELKKYIDMALRFSPGNAEAKKAKDNYQQKTDIALKDFYAAVDKRSWPTHTADSPANANDLAIASLTWFRNDIGWGQRDKDEKAKDKEIRKPLAVAVHGPWSVQERDLLGNPVMYGLPVFVAVEVASEKPRNLVRVYNVTMRTEQKAGVKQAPPFFSITVGDSYYIRPSKLPK